MKDAYIEEIRRLFEYYSATNTMWDTIYNVTTILMLIVAIINLFISCKVYKQAGVLHKESINLTKKMHEDSLTPYIRIASINNCIILHTNKLPLLQIRSVDISDFVKLNELVDVNFDEIKASIHIEMVIANVSNQPAEIRIRCTSFDDEKSICKCLEGNGETIVEIRHDISLLDGDRIETIVNNQAYTTLYLSYIGPGLSAEDSISGQLQLHFNYEDITKEAAIDHLKRERKYK